MFIIHTGTQALPLGSERVRDANVNRFKPYSTYSSHHLEKLNINIKLLILNSKIIKIIVNSIIFNIFIISLVAGSVSGDPDGL